MNQDTKNIIKQTLAENHVVLYMKGTPDFPQCGFSYRVVEVLNDLNINFHAVNVLEDDMIREGIKQYQNWPTIPQLYIKGELIGGCDIVCTLHAENKLAEMV